MRKTSVEFRKQTLLSVVPLAVNVVLNLISVPLFYRYLGADNYALWFYVQTLSGSFGFADLGLGVTMGRYVGVALGQQDQAGARAYWASGHLPALIVISALSCVFIAIGALGGPAWIDCKTIDTRVMQYAFLVGGLTLFAGLYSQLWLILSQAHLDFGFLAVVRSAGTLLAIGPAIYLAYSTHDTIMVLCWSLIACLIQGGALVARAAWSYGGGWGFHGATADHLKKMLSFSLKTVAGMIINAPFFIIDRILLSRWVPAASFAHYSIASNVGQRLHAFSTAVMGPVFHNATHLIGSKDLEGPAKIFNTSFGLVFNWYLFAGIWIAVWNKPVLDLWLGPELAVPVSAVLTPVIIGWCLRAISTTSAALLGPMDRMGAATLFNLFNGLITTASVWIGWRIGGFAGAAWGFAVSQIGWIAQDIFVTLLIGGGGWLAAATWWQTAIQIVVALLFIFIAQLPMFSGTNGMLTLAAIHGIAVSAVLLHRNITSRPVQ